jgi:hypothetical protein
MIKYLFDLIRGK